MPSTYLILCYPLLLASIFPNIGVFSSESVLCIRWPKYWSFSFSISSCKECSGLISFRIDWFNLLAVQGTLKSLLQHHSLKASILGLALKTFWEGESPSFISGLITFQSWEIFPFAQGASAQPAPPPGIPFPLSPCVLLKTYQMARKLGPAESTEAWV